MGGFRSFLPWTFSFHNIRWSAEQAEVPIVISMFVLALGIANLPAQEGVIGTWEALPKPGVLTMERLNFTREGQLWTGSTLVGDYAVVGNIVRAKSRFGDRHTYAVLNDGRLCAYPEASLNPYAAQETDKLGRGLCYRKTRQTSEV